MEILEDSLSVFVSLYLSLPLFVKQKSVYTLFSFNGPKKSTSTFSFFGSQKPLYRTGTLTPASSPSSTFHPVSFSTYFRSSDLILTLRRGSLRQSSKSVKSESKT